MEGLDDFQKVRGFVRGLDKEYQAKVKVQYPKTLDAAIQSALIFDDTMDKRGLDKSKKFNGLQSFAPKHKFVGTSSEIQKKSKGSSGPLSPQEYEQAKKDKLCYHCLANDHEKKNCPQLPRRIRIRARRRLHTWCKSFPWMLLLSIR